MADKKGKVPPPPKSAPVDKSQWTEEDWLRWDQSPEGKKFAAQWELENNLRVMSTRDPLAWMRF